MSEHSPDPVLKIHWVQRTGRYARYIAFCVGGLTILSFAFGLSVRAESADGLDLESIVVAVMFFAVAGSFIARSVVMGVWVTEERVIVRDWFTSYSVLKEQIAACRAVRYYGFITGGVESYANMLEITFIDGSKKRIRGTFAPFKVAKAQAQEVMERVQENPVQLA